MVAPSAVTQRVLEVLQWPGFGAGTVRTIVERMSSDDAASTLDPRDIAGSMFPQKADFPSWQAEAGANKSQEILEHCASLDVSVVSYLDKEYPSRLRGILDAPPIIYVKGDVAAVSTPCIAVVGTRKASKIGLSWSKQIGEMLAERGITTVSGLALGIDAAAHTGALHGGGKTIAILAHGLDTVSPKRNKDIATSLLEKFGALVSEHPPGTPARAPEFVRRNRIQSGMSIASIIVETGEKGGTIHQAKFTIDQGRDLLVILPASDIRSSDSFTYAGGQLLEKSNKAIKISGSAEMAKYLDSIDLIKSDNDEENGYSKQLGLL